MECQLENTTVHYEMLGEGRPLVVLHGAAGDHRLVAAQIEPLFKHRVGWKRIYPNLPGHGATPAQPGCRTKTNCSTCCSVSSTA